MKTELDIDRNFVLLRNVLKNNGTFFKKLLSEAVDKKIPKRKVKNSITFSSNFFYINNKLKSARKKKDSGISKNVW